MSYLIAFLFFAAGLVNFTPLMGVISGDQLEKLYRVGDISPDIELLLRHRAVLFGVVGSIIMTAAFIQHIRLIATIAGLVSMVSFIVLVLAMKNSNPNLLQIAWIDVGATIILLLGFGLHFATANQSPPN